MNDGTDAVSGFPAHAAICLHAASSTLLSEEHHESRLLGQGDKMPGGNVSFSGCFHSLEVWGTRLLVAGWSPRAALNSPQICDEPFSEPAASKAGNFAK
jgi:hypothetical protein